MKEPVSRPPSREEAIHRIADLLAEALMILVETTPPRPKDSARIDAVSISPGKVLRMDNLVEESGLSRWTIMAALQRGELHGGQRLKRGTWHVEEPCFRAWMRGDQCTHQRRGEANEGTPLKSRRR